MCVNKAVEFLEEAIIVQDLMLENRYDETSEEFFKIRRMSQIVRSKLYSLLSLVDPFSDPPYVNTDFSGD